MPSGSAERRAQKAERRAENIRKCAREQAKDQDSRTADRTLKSAENRARKAEKRAENIREYHGVSSGSGNGILETIGGAIVLVILIIVFIAWIF